MSNKFDQIPVESFIRLFLGILLAGLGCISAFILIIDPMFHFHPPLKGWSYFLNKERYQNDGIVKHFEYDALITGTSMAENCKTSEVDNLFGVNSVKTCFEGGSYTEISNNVNVAILSNPDLKLVIRAIDMDGIIDDVNSRSINRSDPDFVYPSYLYDNNPFNDVKYVLNLKVLEYAMQDTVMTLRGDPGTSFDEYSYWNDQHDYGKDCVLSEYERPMMSMEMTQFSEEDRKLAKENIVNNLVIPAEDNPEIVFYYWVPPYSICHFDVENRLGMMDRDLDALEYEFELLSGVPNVRLFCFIDREDIVTDLTLYRDRGHYNGRVNSEILEMISRDEGRITTENYQEYMSEVRSFYRSYDYDSIYDR